MGQGRTKLLGTAGVAALLTVALAGQQTAPPVFRSGADVIEVDTVVRDKDGRFVEDLKPEDFELREEGRPETIDLFYVVGASTPQAVATPRAPSREAAPSAIVAAPPPAPHVFVVVFDDGHLTPGGFKRVQAGAAALFSKYFQPGDIGGVLIHGAMANNRLTSDRQLLLQAVKAAKPTGASNSRLFDLREWPSMNDAEAFEISRKGFTNDDVLEEVARRACVDEPDACVRVPVQPTVFQKAQRMATDIRVSSEQTLRTLAALMNGLERVNGRKTILLLSEGFVADESWPFVQQTVGLAARANTRIYSLDARGLDKGRQPIGNYAPHDDTLGNLLASFDIGADPMNSLAVDTGGFVVRNTNILDAAIGRIVDDASHYYVLGYRPEAAPDGKFRKISVKVKRPGVSVRARSGYVATPRATPTTDEARGSTGSPRADAPSAQRADASRSPRTGSPNAPRTDATGSEPAKPEVGATTVLSPPIAEPTSRTAPGDRARAEAAQPDATPGDLARGEPVEPRALAATLHIRPDASKHVEALAGDAPDADAAAGWSAYERGDVTSARTALAAAAEHPGARPWVHYALGQSQYALLDYTGAIASWERVRAAVPEFEPVYFDLVDGYIQTRDADKAIRLLHSAKRRWPKDAEVDDALGVVEAARGALDDAVKSFSQAVAAAPQEAIGYFNLAKTLELRYQRHLQQAHARRAAPNTSDRDKAITSYKRYLEIGGPFADSAREGLARLNWQ